MKKLKNKWNELSKPAKLLFAALVIIIALVVVNYIV